MLVLSLEKDTSVLFGDVWADGVEVFVRELYPYKNKARLEILSPSDVFICFMKDYRPGERNSVLRALYPGATPQDLESKAKRPEDIPPQGERQWVFGPRREFDSGTSAYITLKKEETLYIYGMAGWKGETVTLVDARYEKARLGLEAPRTTWVQRREIYDAIQAEKANQRRKANQPRELK